MTSDTAPIATKWCLKCGRPDGVATFRSNRAMRCTDCDDKARKNKSRSNQPYHRARYRAWKALMDRHPQEFKELMDRFHPEEKAKEASKNGAQ